MAEIYSEDKEHHIQSRGDIDEYVILPGETIAE